MTKLPENTKTTAYKIVEWWGKKPQGNRPHLGASLIGRECERELWYTFRWAKKPSFDGRMLRLFDRGQKEEARFIEELRGIGAEVFDTDEATGDQIRVSAVNGHFGGSCDGVARGLPEAPKSWAVLEFKTHGAKSFDKLKKEGVRQAKPEHFSQMTVYMHLLDLERALYLAVNKDTDELYSEWLHLDKDHALELLRKAERIVNYTSPPERISDDPAWWKCKFCDYHALCHDEQIADVNCRTCAHSSPAENGSWTCGQGKAEVKKQAGCINHIYIPPLIPYAKPIDGGENYVEYEKADGQKFINGPQHWPSEELFVTLPSLVGDKVIDEIKECFPGAKVVISKPLTVDDLIDDLGPVYAERKEPPTDEEKKIKAAVAALEKQRHTKYKD